MKTIILILALLSAALAAPMLDPEASGDSSSTEDALATTQTPTQETELSASGYNCSLPNNGAEFMLAVGHLYTGLQQLWKYSEAVQHTYQSNVDSEHESECFEPSIREVYLLSGPDYTYNVWDSMAVLEGYAEICKEAINSTANPLSEELEGYMQGIRDVIAAVLTDYKSVLAHKHCECNPTGTCSNGVVLSPPVALSSECKPYPYVASELKSEVYRAGQVFRKTAKKNNYGSTSVSSSQWVADHLSMDSPAYEYFQT